MNTRLILIAVSLVLWTVFSLPARSQEGSILRLEPPLS